MFMICIRSFNRFILFSLALLFLAPCQLHAALVSQNLGVGAYSASGEYGGNSAANAFDGDLSTIWNSGGFATQWIEVDLGQSYDVTQIKLVVEQSPPGDTEHQVWLSSAAIGSATPTGPSIVFMEYTVNDQLLMASLGTAVNARYVQIRTVVSPSWVAWDEIQVFDSMSAVPVPAAVWLFGTGLLGLIGVKWRS
jgi:hypothetical protein